MDPLSEFRGCYLLQSMKAKTEGHTYIGYTNDPRRRIRQHNGEISGGARKTKGKRPWEMVLVVYGFPSEVVALQFEWHWTYPQQSSHLRNHTPTASSLKGLMKAAPRSKARGLTSAIGLLYEMLNLPPFARLPLKIHYFSQHTRAEGLRQTGLPPLPRHIHVSVGEMDQLYAYISRRFLHASDMLLSDQERKAGEEERARQVGASPIAAQRGALSVPATPRVCAGCGDPEANLALLLECLSPHCSALFHIHCLADASLVAMGEVGTEIVPTHAVCPECNTASLWGDTIRVHLLMGGA